MCGIGAQRAVYLAGHVDLQKSIMLIILKLFLLSFRVLCEQGDQCWNCPRTVRLSTSSSDGRRMIGANEESVPPDIVQTEIQRFTAVNFTSMK
jgi:hypothetical protein